MQQNKLLIIIIIVLILIILGLVFFLNLPAKKNGEEPSDLEATTTLRIFFNNNKLDPEFSCNKVFPVERIVLKTQAPARLALELLFEGPTSAEKEQGFFSSIPKGVEIQKLTIENGIAKADFNGALEFQVGGSCWVSAIRSQITQTLKQFPTVDEVLISIDGRTEDILQP